MLDPKTKALLPKIISETMDALHGLSNAPDEMTLPVTLAVANFATQAIVNVNPEQWKSSALSEYFCVIAESGCVKTATFEPISIGIKEFEKQREAEYDTEMTNYQIEIARYQADIKAVAKDRTKPTPEKPVKPRGIRHKVEKPTGNGLINILEAVPFAGLFNSDAAEFFNSHSFQQQEKSNEMVSMLSKVWSGEVVERQTGIEETNIRLHNRRFNMLVMLQHQLADFLKNKQFKDQGFTNRMLITQSEIFAKPTGDFSQAGKQKIEACYTKLDPFNDRVSTLLHMAVDMQLAVRKRLPYAANPNELILENISFNSKDGALQVMEDFYNEMAKEVFNPVYAEYKNFMTRAYEHACRLAATLAVFDTFDRNEAENSAAYRQKFISVQYAEAAVGLMRYFIEQRLNLTIDGHIKANPIVECADDVKVYLKRRGGAVTKQELSQKGPTSYRKMQAEQRRSVFTLLEDNDDIVVVELPGTTKSRYEIRLSHSD